jgi:hypothetical protein
LQRFGTIHVPTKPRTTTKIDRRSAPPPATGVSDGCVRNALEDTDTGEPGAPTGTGAHLRPGSEIAVEPEVERGER